MSVVAIVILVAVVPLAVVFLCMTGILPYPLLSVFANTMHQIKKKGKFAPEKKRTFDYDEIIPNLFVGRQPRHVDDVKHLHVERGKFLTVLVLSAMYFIGVSAILCLNEETELYVKAKDFSRLDLEITRLHIPVPDYQGASQKQLRKAVNFIEKCIDENKSVYVHCNGGKGRSAGVVVAYLMTANPKFEDFHQAGRCMNHQSCIFFLIILQSALSDPVDLSRQKGWTDFLSLLPLDRCLLITGR